jgi:hypothetical protein
MKTRMWIVETDRYGEIARKFYVDKPAYVPRIGEFVDGDSAGGWVNHVQWNYPLDGGDISTAISTVYVYLKEKKND